MTTCLYRVERYRYKLKKQHICLHTDKTCGTFRVIYCSLKDIVKSWRRK